MNPERWRQVRDLFDELVEADPDTRTRRLASVGAADPELRDEVAALLASDTDAEARLARHFTRGPPLRDPLGLSGRTLSHFRVGNPLGAGGMGVVYAAEDTRLGRMVALKVPLPERHLDASGRRRFLHEARSAASLDHPNLCSIHEAGESDDGILFLAMPLYPGETLAACLARDGAIPPRRAIGIARQVALGIAAAHDSGIVHRDLKPGNVMLLPGESVKVLDFGLAKARAEGLSLTGGMLGTAAYMAPEQIRSEPVDGRTDLWALGVLLYEMVTGRRPFRGEHDASLAHAIVHDDPTPPSAVRDGIPSDLEAVILAMLAKDPARRPASAGEVAARLAAMEAGRPAPDQLRRPGRRVLFAAAGAAAAVTLAIMADQRSGGRSGGPIDPNLVAVAPFDATEPDLQIWREGLADILSRNLDGAGPLRTVPPSVAFRRWGGRSELPAAEALGARTGAALVIIGNVMRRGADSVGIRATIRDRARGITEGNLEVAGSEQRIGELADSLGVRILRLLGRTRPIASTRHISIGSRSFPALKEFLRGEQFYRRGEIDSALVHYDRAIAEDSTFALPLRRMNWALGNGAATSWRYGSFIAYARRAVTLNRGLPPRDSALLLGDSLALFASSARSPDTVLAAVFRAVDIVEDLARRHPDDPEIWYELGERYSHIARPAGGSPAAALEAFDRAIALDSGFAPAYMHSLRLAFRVGDVERARRYAQSYVRQQLPVAPTPGLHLAADILDARGVAAPHLRRSIDTASASALDWAANEHFRWWTDSGETTVALFRELAGGGHDVQGAGVLSADPLLQRQALAMSLAFRGHLREAAEVIAPLSEDPGTATGGYRHDPFSDLARFGVLDEAAVRRNFEDAWRVSWEVGGNLAFPPRYLRLLPWIFLRRDSVNLRRFAERGSAMTAGAAKPLGVLRGRYVGAAAAAYLALVRGDTAGAVRRFEAIPDSLCVITLCLSEKLVLAQLLAAQGQDARAAAILDGANDAVSLAQPLHILAALERARIAERLGDRATAERNYRFVIDAWRRPDPGLLPLVEDARNGLARLRGEAES